MLLFHPHQRCVYSDSLFARIYFFYTAGSRNRFEGMEPVATHTKTQKTKSKRHIFLIENCLRTPDSMKNTCRICRNRSWGPLTEELLQKLFKIGQFGSKIRTMIVFLDSGNPKCSRRRPTQPSRPVGFKQETTPKPSNNSNICGF